VLQSRASSARSEDMAAAAVAQLLDVRVAHVPDRTPPAQQRAAPAPAATAQRRAGGDEGGGCGEGDEEGGEEEEDASRHGRIGGCLGLGREEEEGRSGQA
jgi:hypothetical protein